jgi:hypothetical protein
MVAWRMNEMAMKIKKLRWSAAEDNQMNTEEQRRDKKRE